VARILVTGGAGYVGSVCCLQLLERGHAVTVVDDLSTGHANAVPAGAIFHQLDIGDRAALASVLAADRFDAVFHFAAKALIPESVSNPGIFFDCNVASGIALLETVRQYMGIRIRLLSRKTIPSSRSIPMVKPNLCWSACCTGTRWRTGGRWWLFATSTHVAPLRLLARIIVRRHTSYRCYWKQLPENETSLKSSGTTIQQLTAHVCVTMCMSWT
jgi:NAD-dependent epimerase/dehydratase family protein